MAEGALRQELCEEASCSVCLGFCRDPVTIAGCGHAFCRACLTHSGGPLEGAEASCPLCRGPAQEGTLRPNQQLANTAEITQKLSPSEGSTKKRKRGVCDLHQEPLKLFCREDEAPLCLVCSRSREHKGHQEIPLEEASQENTPQAVVAGREERVCQKHQEPLKLFCKEDEALICLVCDRSKEHRDHKILPLDEASQECKDCFCGFLESLKKGRERTVACKANAEKESQDLLKRVTGEKQETVTKFRELRSFLEEQEKRFLAQMEEVEKEVARKRDQDLAEFSEGLSSLDSLAQEIEEMCQQPASELLQGARSILQRHAEKKKFKIPVPVLFALKWQIWDLSNLNPLLEGVVKQVKDSLDSGLHLQKANVTLDPDTAHPNLILSDDWESMRDGEKPQTLPDNPERFDTYGAVLGCEGFTGGRHFWEVLVGREEEWAVGVARKSVRRKGDGIFSPEEGLWVVGKWEGLYRASIEDDDLPLTLSGEPKRIRICLNYEGGRVAFFDTDRRALIFEFSGASFSGETLLPFFWVYGKATLKLSS
ncbi:E3 ubiquitin-protein ligase TRIM7-like isoform X1 [Sphaerodactylus townsendi]|uniref:E3 ubiquitin-protein ligase TRIM7-like isoform X1 n=1 Tax=Sphaerodactylus townsendi TaxID=933632 RepID=UPI002026B7A7|nr:E3 ubiquitin-protein ligase TRIM7-like isoform X1 [Sphaerodactylus townsendi]